MGLWNYDTYEWEIVSEPMICIDGTYDEDNIPPLFDSFCSIIMRQFIRNSTSGFLKYMQGYHS